MVTGFCVNCLRTPRRLPVNTRTVTVNPLTAPGLSAVGLSNRKFGPPEDIDYESQVIRLCEQNFMPWIADWIAAQSDFKIGIVASLTGAFASAATDENAGVQAWVKAQTAEAPAQTASTRIVLKLKTKSPAEGGVRLLRLDHSLVLYRYLLAQREKMLQFFAEELFDPFLKGCVEASLAASDGVWDPVNRIWAHVSQCLENLEGSRHEDMKEFREANPEVNAMLGSMRTYLDSGDWLMRKFLRKKRCYYIFMPFFPACFLGQKMPYFTVFYATRKQSHSYHAHYSVSYPFSLESALKHEPSLPIFAKANFDALDGGDRSGIGDGGWGRTGVCPTSAGR